LKKDYCKIILSNSFQSSILIQFYYQNDKSLERIDMKKNDEVMYEISKMSARTQLLINFTDIKNEDFAIYANKDFKLKSDRNFIIDPLCNDESYNDRMKSLLKTIKR